MDPTYRFRRVMLSRLLDAVGVAALSAPILVAASCGGRVVVDVGEDGLGGAGAGGTGGLLETVTGTGTGTGTGCQLTSSGVTSGSAGPVLTQLTECFAPQPTGCPDQYQAMMYIIPGKCNYVVSVDCGPITGDGSCCYLVTEQTEGCVGRPFTIDGEPRSALAVFAERGWTTDCAAPEMDGLAPALREALARAWEADALLEHASIAAFSRFALELLAVGAPADLLAAAHQAALDEVRHARLCFTLARRYRGAPVAPQAFPFGGSIAVNADLAAVAAATAREGCIGETLAATLAADQLARTTDAAVKRVLATIAEDESRHAELAWRTLAWAIERGGDEVRAAVSTVFAEAERYLPSLAADAPSCDAHGRLSATDTRTSLVRALDEVVRPCAQALLSKPPPSITPSSKAPA